MPECRIIVFERCHGWAFWLLVWNVMLGREVYVVEPYYAYHHGRTPMRFFPRSLPAFVKKLIEGARVKVVSAAELGCRDHYLIAAEQAVQYCEDFGEVFLSKVCCKDFMNVYRGILGEATVEQAVKMSVCNALAEFLSTRLLLNALRKSSVLTEAAFVPACNVRQYLFIEKMWFKFEPGLPGLPLRAPSVILGFDALAWGVILCGDIIRGLVKAFMLFVNSIFRRALVHKEAVYGVSLISLQRQMGAQKSLGFFVDGVLIREDDVLYFNYVKCDRRKKAELSHKFANIIHVQDAGILWSDFCVCLRVMGAAMRGFSLEVAVIYKDLSLVTENYFLWKQLGEWISLKNFVTHGDFGAPQLGRNLAWREKDVRTWLFMDSANQTYNFIIDGNNTGARHPFWCYLDYDQFVVWSPFLAQYFSSHPGSARRFQVTGCLWADYIQPRRDVLVKMSAELQEWLQGKKVVAAFDSTYSRRGYTSYQEGILFARHILLLADMSADLVVLWKEKKPRGVHYQLDDGSADELLAVYAKLDGHPRVMNVTSVLTAGDMVSVADLVISFPFTSTSLEALSAHRRAVWHDPLAFYKRSVYSDRLVTHGWEELRVLVDCLLRGEDLSLAEADTKMMDPYCDGRAVERFRKLLAEA